MIARRMLGKSPVLRYLGAAIVGASVDFGVFGALIYGPGVHYLAAGVAGFVLATLANYLVTIRWVFPGLSRFPRSRELIAIYLVSAVGLLWHQAILWVCVEHLAVHVMLAKVLAVGAVFFWNYGARRRWIFAPGSAAAAQSTPEHRKGRAE
jgi:putative flippase GtrA